MNDIEYNWYSLDMAIKNEMANTPSVAVSSSNISSSGGVGTVMSAGDMRSANFVKGSAGWQLSSTGNLEASDGNFRGDITGATGTFSGNISGGSIDIGGNDTTSAHIDTDGNFWTGASVADKATAPARITKTGAAYFSDVTVTGGSLNINSGKVQIGTDGVSTFSDFQVNARYISVASGESLQSAINTLNSAGGGIVALKTGTHVLSDNLTLYSGIYLQGVTRTGTVIDFETANKSILIQGSNAYTAGTVTVANNSTTVTGDSTTWTSGMIGRSIMLGGIWYLITSRTSNTEIGIAAPYAGAPLSGASYTIATIIYDVFIKDLTVKNSGGSAIKFQYASYSYMENVELDLNALGLEVLDSSNLTFSIVNTNANNVGNSFDNVHYVTFFEGGGIDSLTGNHFTLDTVTNGKFDSIFTINSAADGWNITNCNNIMFNGCISQENAGQGFELVSGNSNLVFSGCGAENNASDGMKFTATSDTCFINSCTFSGNGGYGVNLAASTDDNNVISGNTFSTNASGSINDLGTTTVISGNVPDSVNPNLSKLSVLAGEAITAGDAVYGYGNGFAILNGSTQFFSHADDAHLDIVGDMTIEAWVNIDTLPSLGNSVGILGKWSTVAGNYSYRLSLQNDSGDYKLRFQVSANGTNITTGTSSGPSTTGDWYHVAVVYDKDSGYATFYLDGVEGDTGTSMANSIYDGTAPFAIGIHETTTSSEGGFLDGKIDDVRLWNVMRTGAQITANYQTELNGNETGLVGNWQFNLDPNDTVATNPHNLTNNGTATFSSVDAPYTISQIKIKKTDANVDGKWDNFIGFATSAISTGSFGLVLVSGVATNLSGLVPNTHYYLSDTPGAVSSSVGTNTRKVGIALSATNMLITNIW